MSGILQGRWARSLAIASLVLALGLLLAGPAFALFTKVATGGPMAVATASLGAPGKANASQYNCRSGKSPEVEVGWLASTSTYATSYSVERSTAAAGPYTLLASVAIGKLSYIDAGPLSYSTTYYYRVSSVFHSWSAPTAYTTVKTLNKSCV